MTTSEHKSVQDPIPKYLFDILACPGCKADLKYSKDKKELVCVKCRAKYSIKDNVPVLLPKGFKIK